MGPNPKFVDTDITDVSAASGDPATASESSDSSTTAPTTTLTTESTTAGSVTLPTSMSSSISTTDPTNVTSTVTSITSSTNSDSDTGISCEPVQWPIVSTDNDILLLVDKSASMLDEMWMGDGMQVTRWQSVWTGVNALLTAYEHRIWAILQLFSEKGSSNQGEGACLNDQTVDVTVLQFGKDEIMTAMPVAESMQGDFYGSAPTSSHITSAAQYLSSLPPDGWQFILLITDGAPSCGDAMNPNDLPETYDPTAITEIQKARDEHDIHTLVVGLEISEQLNAEFIDLEPDGVTPDEVLNAMALAGGLVTGIPGELYINATSGPDLVAKLLTAGSVMSRCWIPIPPEVEPPQNYPNPDTFYGDLILTVEDVEFSKVGDCLQQTGFTVYEGTNRDALVLCGASCEAFNAIGSGQLELPVPCP